VQASLRALADLPHHHLPPPLPAPGAAHLVGVLFWHTVASMKGIEVLYGVITLGALAIGIAVPYFTHERGSAAVPGWQTMVDPGELSTKHQFLAAACEACHTPHKGAMDDKWIVCHSNAHALPPTPPAALPATLGGCGGCPVGTP